MPETGKESKTFVVLQRPENPVDHSSSTASYVTSSTVQEPLVGAKDKLVFAQTEKAMYGNSAGTARRNEATLPFRQETRNRRLPTRPVRTANPASCCDCRTAQHP